MGIVWYFKKTIKRCIDFDCRGEGMSNKGFMVNTAMIKDLRVKKN